MYLNEPSTTDGMSAGSVIVAPSLLMVDRACSNASEISVEINDHPCLFELDYLLYYIVCHRL
jgi:hypothetical protein